MPARIAVIVNSAAGSESKRAAAAELKRLFAAHGAEVEVVAVESSGTLITEARRVLEAGCDTLVAAGGDGTVGSLAALVVDTDVKFGVLPLGTLNHFAKDLGLPLVLEEAIQVIVAGRVKAIDVGEVNGKVFVNNSSLGLYPTIVKHREAEQRLGKSKWSAFVRAVLTVFGRYSLIRVTLDIDGVRITRKTPIVFIGNNGYHFEGLQFGKRDHLDHGRLSVYLTPDVGRFGLFVFALRALFRRLRNVQDFAALETSALTISSRQHHMRVATDGEINTLRLPLEYRIRAGALRVIVPTAVAGATSVSVTEKEPLHA